MWIFGKKSLKCGFYKLFVNITTNLTYLKFLSTLFKSIYFLRLKLLGKYCLTTLCSRVIIFFTVCNLPFENSGSRGVAGGLVISALSLSNLPTANLTIKRPFLLPFSSALTSLPVAVFSVADIFYDFKRNNLPFQNITFYVYFGPKRHPFSS